MSTATESLGTSGLTLSGSLLPEPYNMKQKEADPKAMGRLLFSCLYGVFLSVWSFLVCMEFSCLYGVFLSVWNFLVYMKLFHKLFDSLQHLWVLLFHAAQQLVLGPCADEVVVWIGDLVVFVPVDVVHKEAEHLLECDVER